MTDRAPPKSEMILYQTEDGRTRIQCRFEDETLWLSQAQIGELFQTTVANINLHLKAIYAEGELAAAATIKSHLIVRREGSRQFSRPVLHYSLPVIVNEQRSRSLARLRAALLPHLLSGELSVAHAERTASEVA